jgi:tetratricopeptide (TPR) repeat protein
MEKTTEGGKGFIDFGKKKCYWAQPVLESAYKKEKASFDTKAQKESDDAAFASAQKFLNGALFFTYVPQDMEVYFVKSKDFDYSDLAKAAEIAKTGYEGIKDNADDKDAKSRLLQATVIWEKALAESTPDNKKSRINKKVTLHISENLGNAYLYLMEFDKAQKVVGSALALEKNVTTNGTNRRKALLAAIRENKKGYGMNQNTPINTTTAKVKINRHPHSDVSSFVEDYKKYGNAELANEIAASKEEYDKAVASGEVNPYQRYVVAVTGGDMLTLPDLASKLAGEPAGNKLEELPEEVTQLNLATLVLRGNNLKSLPPSIGNMTGLKKLVLTNNQITTLPDEIGNLKNLKNLVIKGNNISAKEVARIQAMLPGCKIKQ